MNRQISLVLLVIGIVLLVFGISASDSFSSEVSEFFTGAPTNKTIWLVIGGIACVIVGLLGFARQTRKVEEINVKQGLLILFVLLFAAMSSPRLSAEIVSANTAKAAIATSDASDSIHGKLVAQGMTPAAATDLVQQMSADEISYFSQETDRNQAGGDLGGFIIFALVVTSLVFLIIYLAQRT